MKEVTRPGDRNRYFLYKGHFITRTWHNGLYSTFSSGRRLMADTQKGIKKLINEDREG